MRTARSCLQLLAGLLAAQLAAAADQGANAPAAKPAATRSMAEILAASPASAWRPLNDEHTLYMEMPGGRVVIELLPALAPRTVANIEALVRLHYFDGLSILRVQDNYVTQWGDPDGVRKVPDNMQKLAPEFSVKLGAAAFTRLPDADGYAPQVGFVDSFPAARDPTKGTAWLTHCYGAIGVGRDVDPASGNGAELYAVIGNAPRHLDGNVTVVGRVRQGIELLSSLPRGTAELGFYDKPEQRITISSVQLASALPPEQRTHLEVLRSDSPTFTAVVESRRNRKDDWYLRPAGYIELCNVPLPVRAVAPPAH